MPITFVNIDIWNHAFSLKWYAANTLVIPTAMHHVPQSLDARGVTGDGCDSAKADEETEGRWLAGEEVDSSTMVVVLVVFVAVDRDVASWPG